MQTPIFNTSTQTGDVSSKIIVGLERISEAFRVLLWQHAKVTGLSPIQIQILIFVAYHVETMCSVSHLALEFNMTKPTISDAIKVLDQKNLIKKQVSEVDKRAYTISLTPEGEAIVKQTEFFAQPLYDGIAKLPQQEQVSLFSALGKVISGLNTAGILSVQRTCFACSFYEKKQKGHYCNLIEKPLTDSKIRLDCNEFKATQIG